MLDVLDKFGLGIGMIVFFKLRFGERVVRLCRQVPIQSRLRWWQVKQGDVEMRFCRSVKMEMKRGKFQSI